MSPASRTNLQENWHGKEPGPLTNAEAFRRATANGTTNLEEQARETARLRSPDFFPKATAKLNEAERKLQTQLTAVEQHRGEQATLINQWDEMLSQVDELATRVALLHEQVCGHRDGIANMESQFLSIAGTSNMKWMEYPDAIFSAKGALPILEAAYSTLRKQYAPKVAELRAFAAKHSIPREVWPELPDELPDAKP